MAVADPAYAQWLEQTREQQRAEVFLSSARKLEWQARDAPHELKVMLLSQAQERRRQAADALARDALAHAS